MGRYVYIDEDSKKGRFGIGIGIFQLLADEALTRIPDLVSNPVKAGHHRRLRLNSTDVAIHRGVVRVKVNVNAKQNVNVHQLQQRIIDEINSSFMMVAEQVPFKVKVKVENAL